MVLNGNLLSSWQRGRRRFAIEGQYQYRRWYAPNLFSSVMRPAVFALSNGVSVGEVTSAAVNRFLSCVKHPGLDVQQGTNTYTLAMDFAATIRTVLEFLSRNTLLTLTPHPVVDMGGDLTWSLLSHKDESGMLHRWVFTDYINDDAIMKELHSWQVMGDMVAARAPMLLHLVSIGQTRNSRRVSPWARAYKSPTILGLLRFQKKSGDALNENWKPVWFGDNPSNSASAWVDQMMDDNATIPLVQHISVREPAETHAANCAWDIQYEHQQMLMSGVDSSTFDPMSLPMCRVQCDTPYICPHQQVCYSTKLTLATSGLYDKIPRKKT